MLDAFRIFVPSCRSILYSIFSSYVLDRCQLVCRLSRRRFGTQAVIFENRSGTLYIPLATREAVAVLQKRYTILDSDDSINYPSGIQRYPHQQRLTMQNVSGFI